MKCDEMKIVSCNLCGDSVWETLFYTQDLKYGVDGEFSVVRCKNCGLVFLNPQPLVERLKIHYPGPDYHGHKKVGIIPVQDAMTSGRFSYPERKENICKYKKRGKILDVGCADGYFLASMREKGWQVYGIEASEYAGRFTRDVLGIEVYIGLVETFDCPWTDFDVVTFYHVLEHLHDPQLALCKAANILKTGGLLAIEVPNIDNFLFNTYRLLGASNRLYRTLSQETDWNQYPHYLLDVPRHLYFFSPNTLSQMLIKANMQIIRCKHDYIGTNGVIDTAIYLWRDLQGGWKGKLAKQLDVVDARGKTEPSVPFYNESLKSLVLLASRLILQCLKLLRKGDRFTIYARKR